MKFIILSNARLMIIWFYRACQEGELPKLYSTFKI